MKSLITKREHFVLDNVPHTVQETTLCMDGDYVIDVIRNPLEGRTHPYRYLVWHRSVTDDPRCDGCLTHRWKLVAQSIDVYPHVGHAHHSAVLAIIDRDRRNRDH